MILVFQYLRQKDDHLKVSLSYMLSSCLKERGGEEEEEEEQTIWDRPCICHYSLIPGSKGN